VQKQEIGEEDAELNKAIDEAQKQQIANLQEQEALRAKIVPQLQAIKNAQDEVTKATQEQNKAMVESSFSLNLAQNAAGLYASTLSEGLRGILDGTKANKEAFKQLAIQFLIDMGMIIAEMLILIALDKASNGLVGAFLKTTSTVTGKASGGDIKSGSPYLVGEKGAELIIPDQDATVIPAGAFGGGSGGDVTVQNNFKIEVINQTSQNVQASMSTEQREEGKEMVISVILNDTNSAGPITNALSRTFGISQQPR